jgi:hypothetical protein
MMGLFSAFSDLLNSTTFKFVMICAVLGDKAYDAKYDPGRAHAGYDVIPYGEEKNHHVLTPANRMYINRFTGPTEKSNTRSSLSLHLYNSILLQPRSMIAAASSLSNQYGGIKSQGTEADKLKDNLIAGSVKDGGSLAATLEPTKYGRFSADLVDEYERFLDLEYTPFYMHDLRTNEIIAMPAFISSVGESITPDWSETHGYGRTDPVRTYSKTNRTIDLSFKLVAMNPTDMNFMWVVINKLVAMCYPQRSVGAKRTVTIGDKAVQFVQPFSQVPTASPVIRLRLGELFHSNYSLDGLKRLFGYPDNWGPPPAEGDEEAKKAAHEKYVQAQVQVAARAAVKSDITQRFTEAEGNAYTKDLYYDLQPGTRVVFNADDKGGIIAGLKSMIGPPNFEKKFVSAVVKTRVTFNLISAKPVNGKEPRDGKKFPNKFYKASLDFSNSAEAQAAFGKKFKKIFPEPNAWSDCGCYVDIESLQSQGQELGIQVVGAVPKMLADKAEDLLPGIKKQIEKTQEQLEESGFFKAENNAIVRSFRSAGGRGLAGVITSLALNYDGANFGTGADAAARAPMSVTITLGFAPIHDLPLGLDSSGELTAPSHPVGALNPYYDGQLKRDSKLDVAPYQPGVKTTKPDDSLLGSLKNLSPF